MRVTTATVVLFAVVAVPLVLDQCAATCDAHRDVAISTPKCHHSGSAGTHIGATPRPCGHDHSGAAATASKSADPSSQRIALMSAIAPAPTSYVAVDRLLHASSHAPPGPRTSVVSQSPPLRI